MAHPAVAVVGTSDPQFGEAVVAFVERKRGAQASKTTSSRIAQRSLLVRTSTVVTVFAG
jgi:acyl-coenzyme A synthetase/AMP-(fatty) acid ligase